MKRVLFILFLSLALFQSLVFYSFAAGTDSDQEELFLVAQKAFEDGFYDVAIRYIEQFLQKYPQNEKRVQAQLLLGQCYFFQNQYLKAFDIFQKLLSYTEFHDATVFWIGETYFKGSDYRQAEKYYRELIDVYPNSIYLPQGYYSLGWTYFEEGDYRKAKDIFLQLIKKFPANQLTEDAIFKIGECEYQDNRYAEAVQFFSNFISRFPKSARQAEALFYMGEAYYNRDDFLTAVTYYAKAADMAYDPKIALMSKVSMGWCYLKLERYDLSQQFFDQAQKFAVEKQMESDDILFGQANLAAAREDFAKAKAAYTELIDKFPNSLRITEARLGKANSDYTLKNYSEAISEYQQIIEALGGPSPKSDVLEKAYYGLAWTYLKSGNIDASIRYFEDIMSKTESKIVKISALTQIGDAYNDADQLDKAIEIYDRILKNYPDSMYADYVQFRQGIALLKQNKIEAATLSFMSLQSNFPQSKYLDDIKYYLGLSYFKKEDWPQAIHYIDEYLKGTDRPLTFKAEASYVRALSQFNLKNYQEAMAHFETIVKENSQDAMVRISKLNIAKCLYFLGRTADAIEHFQDIIKRYPLTETGQEALLWLGDYFLENGQWDNAVSYYQKFLTDFPGSEKVPYANYEIGQAYQAQNNFDKALQFYKMISDKDSKEIYAKAKLAIADIFSRRTDSQTAIETYRNIASTIPEFRRDAYVKMAMIQIEKKQFPDAIRSYEQALEAEKMSSELSNAELQFHIGDTYEILNNPEKAIEIYLKIPYLYPDQTVWVVKAYLRTGRIFEESERWREAESIYQKIAAIQVPESKYALERITWIRQHTLNKSGT